MDAIASALLERLLRNGESVEAGARRRAAVLTERMLAPYRSLKELTRKEQVEAAFKAARSQCLVELRWDGREQDGGFIKRVELLDPPGLARLLGREPAGERRARAAAVLEPHLEGFPVLRDVLARWAEMKTVRGMGPEDVEIWRDAAVAVASARCQMTNPTAESYRPIRMASAALFRDSKRLEAITPAMDVLLAGAALAEPRAPQEVWAEMGLAREEQPLRLAGRVTIVRERVTALLDAPYAAFPVATVLGVEGEIQEILSIENLTTFHQEALRRCADPMLLIYTGGAPSPAWRAMYARVLKSIDTAMPIRHWGDVDEGGFRIAAQIAKVAAETGRALAPYRMHPSDVPLDMRRPAPRKTLAKMRSFACAAGWTSLAEEIDLENGFTVEQEAL